MCVQNIAAHDTCASASLLFVIQHYVEAAEGYECVVFVVPLASTFTVWQERKHTVFANTRIREAIPRSLRPHGVERCLGLFA